MIVLRARLLEIVERPAVIQALTIASPPLQKAIALWKNDPECKKGLQAERSLVRYFLRMTTRPTPFGLFSGCSLGDIRLEASTELVLAPNKQYRSATRLDFDYLFALTDSLRRDKTLRVEMSYSGNSSLHRSGSNWHYVESRLDESFRTHHLVKLMGDEYLDSVLACANVGQRSFAQLADVLASCDDSTILTTKDISDYLHELIDSEVIVPSILPVLTGKPPLDSLLEELHTLPSAQIIHRTLNEIKSSLTKLDQRPLDVSPEEYEYLTTKLEGLPAVFDKSRIFQVDMFKPVQSANLGKAVLDQVSSALTVLGRFTVPEEPRDLVNFRKAFADRYEQAWIPLLEALDAEAGIGYGLNTAANGSPLLQGLPLDGIKRSDDTMKLDKFQSLLLQKLLDCTRNGKHEIELLTEDIESKNDIDELLPESFSVVVSLISKSTEALKRGEFEMLYKGGLGPSGVRAMGRFCLADRVLEDSVRKALREEEALDPNCVYAEIVYLPEGRVGNVLCRPVLRDYEIVYLGQSGAAAEKQLRADDFLISLQQGEIVLYSQSLKRRVKPRLSNSHNYGNANVSPVYKFLCELQNQGGILVPSFNWGALAKLDALPRVRAGRIVLCRAQWRLSAEEIGSLSNSDRYTAFTKIKELQRKRGLPRWVSHMEYDNLLPIDLDNPLSIDSLIHLLKRSPEATLIELYPQYENRSVTGPEGAYEHELVIPLSSRRSVNFSDDKGSGRAEMDVRQIESSINTPRSERMLMPTGDWHFVKIYGGSSILDDLLAENLGSVISTLIAEGSLKRWFFVRYADPETHLRLRFYTQDRAVYDHFSRRLELLLVDGSLWKLQLDTYQREIERYGGLDGLLASEEIFCADSEAVIKILRSLDGDEGADMRWKIALLGIDIFLNDCGLEIHDKLRFMRQLRSSFANEFHLTDPDKEKLAVRFRHDRNQLQSMLRRDVLGQSPTFDIALDAFGRRSEQMRSAISRLRKLDESDALTTSFLNIVASHIHMNVNRIAQASPRAHELVLYDYLYRFYDGIYARAQNEVSHANQQN
jgi:thiopeptide-type bacteriocin biosynthesis protein